MFPPQNASLAAFSRLGAKWRKEALGLFAFSVFLASGSAWANGVEAAWDLMRLGRWDEAEARLQSSAKQDGEKACAARFAEGMLWQNRRPSPDLARAVASYQWILASYPQSQFAPWALLEMARIPDLDVLSPRLEEAIPLYRRVMNEYPGSDAAQEAALFLADALFAAQGRDGAQEAVHLLENWKTAHPNPSYVAAGELLLGKLYRYPLRDYRKSVEHLGAALNGGLRSSSERLVACWTMATLAERELKDRELAVASYSRLLGEFPHHRTAFMAKERLRALGAPVPALEDRDLESLSK